MFEDFGRQIQRWVRRNEVTLVLLLIWYLQPRASRSSAQSSVGSDRTWL